MRPYAPLCACLANLCKGWEVNIEYILSDPPRRYNSLLTMADDIRLQLMESGVVETIGYGG